MKRDVRFERLLAAVSGAAIPTIGVILMVVGGIGVLMSLLFMMRLSP